MKKIKLLFFITTLLLSSSLFAQLEDVQYTFDQNKILNSKDSFHFLRSFVDLFYLVLAKNKSNLYISKKLGNISGWCAGDAHPENFGSMLLENEKVIFSINDMDDSGSCPVAFDFLRLLVSSKLFDNEIKVENLINAYFLGLNGKYMPIPQEINDLIKESQQNGMQIDPKKLQGNLLKRKQGSVEVDVEFKKIITQIIEQKLSNEGARVLDIVSFTKSSGGSAGMERFEILIENSQNKLIHLELKELIAPSIYPVATESIPSQSERMKKSLEIDQGQIFSHYYTVINMNSKDMLLRPKFSGNVGLSLTDYSAAETEEAIAFEAFVLGRIHSETVDMPTYLKLLNETDVKDWETDVDNLVIFFNQKYEHLKNN
jgi:hypothetical protein